MLSLFIGIQYLGIIIIFAQVMVLLFYRPSYLQRMLLVVELATLVNHVGCLLMMQATTAETALMAVKCALCMFHVLVSLLVLTCEKQSLFYRKNRRL